jgi:hypothetical protein
MLIGSLIGLEQLIDLNIGSSISEQTIHFRAKLYKSENIGHQILKKKHLHVDLIQLSI